MLMCLQKSVLGFVYIYIYIYIHAHTLRGGAKNFDLGGPSCDANILVKTNLYTHMYINYFTKRIYHFLNFNEHIKVMYFFY